MSHVTAVSGWAGLYCTVLYCTVLYFTVLYTVLWSRTRGRKRLNHHNTHLAHTESLLARDVGWAVLDVAVSGAGDCLVYSSWSDHLHAVQLDRGEPGDRPHTPLTLSQVTRADQS